MGLYDGIKDVASIVQKANNIDLYKQLLDLSSQALELQNEKVKLQQENTELKKSLEIQNDIERYPEFLCVTLKSDSQKIMYCSKCWDAEGKLIQIETTSTINGFTTCYQCRTSFKLYKEKYNEYILKNRKPRKPHTGSEADFS